MLALWLLALLLGTAFLAHRRTAPLLTIGIVAGFLVLMGMFSHAPTWLMGLFWLLLLAVALPLLLPQQRRSLFTSPPICLVQTRAAANVGYRTRRH